MSLNIQITITVQDGEVDLDHISEFRGFLGEKLKKGEKKILTISKAKY